MNANPQNAPQPEKETRLQRFNRFISGDKAQDYLTKVLEANKTTFVTALIGLVANNDKLQDCEPETLMFAALEATALDLPIGILDYAYIIPYKNKKKGITEAQLQIGYKGYIQLAERTGQYDTINVRDVREGELIGEDYVTGAYQFKAVEDREKKPVIGYISYFRLNTGFWKMFYWTIDKVKAHANTYSKTYRDPDGLWNVNFDAMARKTVLKNLLSKWAPVSVKLQRALRDDQAIIDEQGYHYDDNSRNSEEQKAINAEVANKLAAAAAQVLTEKPAAPAAVAAPATPDANAATMGEPITLVLNGDSEDDVNQLFAEASRNGK